MKKISILTLLTVCFAAPVWADSASTPNVAYAAIDVGSVKYSNNNFQTNSQTGASSPTATAAGISAGYNINQMLAVEAGYTNFSSATVVSYGTQNSGPISASALDLAAVGTWHINDSFAVFGKMGVAHDSFNINVSGNNFMYGVGGQYNINSNWGVRAQYQDFGKTTAGTGNIDLKVASVGVVYGF